MIESSLMGVLAYFAYLALVPLAVVGCILYFCFRDWHQRKAEESWRGIRGVGERARDADVSAESSQKETDSQAESLRVIRPSRDPLGYVFSTIFLKGRLEREGESTSATIVDLDIEGEYSGRQRIPDLLPFWLRNTRRYEEKRVWLTYRFRVPDRPAVEYEGRFEAGDSRYLAMVIGKTVQVRYLPEDPRVSRLEL